MAKLTSSEIDTLLQKNPDWNFDSGKLVRSWTFANFVQAMIFVNHVAEAAEAAGHHPDIDIRYNTVRLGLVSHDDGGITDRDARMIASLNQI